MVVRYLLIAVWCLGLAFAQDYKFIVAYEDPADDVQAEYKGVLEEDQFLEGLIEPFNNSIALPENIGVVGAPCGDANAYWDPTARAMIICYELFDLMYAMFRDDAQSDEELFAEIFGATRFIFYHELGHALIDIFNIPFTGREEDAVDQFSTMLLLGSNDVGSALAGANFFYKFASVTELDQLVFWGEHSLDQQRFYGIVCLVYGSDPETYDFLLQRDRKGFLLSSDEGYLPKERAERCYEEYKAISSSWNTLIASYVPSKDGSELAIGGSTTPTVAVADVLETTDYAQTFSGTLQEGDDTLDNGEYFDYHELQLVKGQEVTFELSSTEFDTYLIVSAPDDFGYVNDDATIKVDGYLSKLTIPISTSGTWVIGVSSYEKGQTGDYQVGVVTYDDIYNEVVTDSLADGDSAYESGELVDYYDYPLEKGQRATIVLSSLDFDPYLIVTTPSGETLTNDDFENQFGMARLDFDAAESGTYTVAVTSYAKEEKGAYQLAVSDVGAPLPTTTVDAGADANGDLFSDLQEGTLSSGDSSYETGEYYDVYSYDFTVGQNIIVDAISGEFNTYLEVQYPDGEKFYNDDYKEDATDAGLDVLVEEAGTYTFYVSSSKAGETGSYAFYISDTGPQETTAQDTPGENSTGQDSTDVAADTGSVLFEDEQYGALSAEDSAYESGEYFDVYTYEFTAGQNILAGAISDAFDTYLVVDYPNGEQFSNDNYEKDSTSAFLEVVVPETGTYTFYVTSSKAGDTGEYGFYVSDLGSEATATTTTKPTGTQASTQDPVEEATIDITDLSSTKARNSNIGVLESGDDTLDDGSYVDFYSVDLEAGQEASFSLVSADFNTYLGVMKPNGEVLDLDEQQDQNRSRITLSVEETGTWFVFVTSLSTGEEGNYLLSIKK
jgi:hypothetical protein